MISSLLSVSVCVLMTCFTLSLYWVLSSIVRKFATLLCLPGNWYIFHLDRLRKSISSCNVRSRLLVVRKVMYLSMSHSVAPWRCEGQRFSWGRSRHSLGILSGIVRSILAITLFVNSHIVCPCPHSVKRCITVCDVWLTVHRNSVWIRKTN
jgi:hypothetical protein